MAIKNLSNLNKYKQIAQIIKNADAIVISAGAGMGVDSGLPDFRGPQGFWREYPAIEDLGIRFEEMANPFWFEKEPTLAWAFYGHRLKLYRETKPHKGFDMLLEIAKEKKNGYFVLTSNVDGHFPKAGFSDDKIYEIHGSIHHLQCTKPCCTDIWQAKNLEIQINEKFRAISKLPVCPKCGRIARPNILMFGDFYWVSMRSDKQSDRFYNWISTVKNSKIVVIEIGAGKAVPTIRLKSQRLVRNYNATLIRINPRDFDVPDGQISLAENALSAITQIFNEHQKL